MFKKIIRCKSCSYYNIIDLEYETNLITDFMCCEYYTFINSIFQYTYYFSTIIYLLLFKIARAISYWSLATGCRELFIFLYYNL
ncbi:hypothetical protein QTP88_014713 [Uroleucon formosanum]